MIQQEYLGIEYWANNLIKTVKNVQYLTPPTLILCALHNSEYVTDKNIT